MHHDFLNADHAYVHKNKSFRGFGSYGDLLVRDRKMYVAPTPFALTNGTTGQATLIAPEELNLDGRLERVGDLVRTETEHVVVGYTFDLHANKLTPELAPNPTAGKQHSFACKLLCRRQRTQALPPVSEEPQCQKTSPAPGPVQAPPQGVHRNWQLPKFFLQVCNLSGTDRLQTCPTALSRSFIRRRGSWAWGSG